MPSLPFHTIPTGRLDEIVGCVEIRVAVEGMVNLFVCAKGSDILCIDSGTRPEETARGLQNLGFDPGSVGWVFLTHSDFDHAGGLAALPGAQVFLSAGEERMIDGTTTRSFGFMRNKPLGREWTPLHDGDVVRAGSFEVRAVATPGHTPGSMSYLVDNSYLFVGDAMLLREGRARPFPSMLVMDRETHQASLRRLAGLQGVEMLFTAHGGYTTDFSTAMRDWADPA